MHRTRKPAGRRSLALAAAAAAVATFATLLPGAAGAATTPAITTTSPNVLSGGTITINGTGCEPSGDAIVHLFTGYGTPSSNLLGTVYPITTDTNGSFTASWPLTPPPVLADGTVITLVGECPFTQAGLSFTPITVTVGPAVTSTTSAPSTTAPAPTTTPTTMTPTTAPPAAPATPLAVKPTYTG